jgi:peptide/nickel transport system permease protein
MDIINYSIRRLIYGIPLVFGVTLFSFVSMVYFGPDKTYELAGKNPTQQQITEIRHQLGYDRPFHVRYTEYVKELATFNFGHSDSTGEKVIKIFRKTVPVSLMEAFPGFILGNLISIVLAMIASYYRGKRIDKVIMVYAVIGMSISYLIVVIGFQVIFCSSFGLDLFPVQGWEVNDLASYINYVTVPTLATIFVVLGYNTRFYRAVFVEELTRDHVRTAKAYGIHPLKILFVYVLKNSMVPITTRVIISIPLILIGGNLIVEHYFNIPGIGLVTYDAITSGDLPIVKAVVGIGSIIYVFTLLLTDIIYKVIDPRITLK